MLALGPLAFIADLEPAVFWVIAGLVGLILEMIVPAFVIGSFGVSAFFAALAAFLGASVPLQITIFGLVGFLLVVPARRYLHRNAPSLRLGNQNLPGKLATCLEPIDGDLQTGVVQLDGSRWTAVTDRGTRIAQGSTVEVVSVDGVRLFVRPHDVRPHDVRPHDVRPHDVRPHDAGPQAPPRGNL